MFFILICPWGAAAVFGQVVFSGPETWRAAIHLEFSPETLAREPELEQKLQKVFSRHISPQGAAYSLKRRDPVPGGRGYTLTLEGTGGPTQLKKVLQVAADPNRLPGDGALLLELSGKIGPGESLPLALEANPSTGYIWEVTAADPQKLVQRGPGSLQAQSRLLGAPMTQTILLEGSGGGETTLQVTYRRPWLKDQPPARKAAIQLTDLSQAAAPGRLDPIQTFPPLLEPPVSGSGKADLPVLQLAGSFDWRNVNGQNYLPPIRNQGLCGSCWAFGTVAPLEAAVKIKQGLSVDLSEQYLISCNFGETYDYGCNGGWFAHQYHQWKIPTGEPAGGAVKETDYPYTGSDSVCTTPHAHPQKITNWAYVNPANPYDIPAESDIKTAIAVYGVVAAAVCSGPAMAAYDGGVFSVDESAVCGGSVNHAIALVGWDDADGTWIMRNSWGPSWGENGYMRIKRDVSNIGFAANYVIYDPPQPTQFTATHWSYLPVILNNRSNCQEPLCNGNFESGPTGGWNQSSAKGWELIMNLGNYDYLGLYNHQGTYAAWLGGDYSETAVVSQTMTVPAAVTHLGFWYWIDSADSCGFDFAKVYFNETLLKTYDLCFSRDTGTWIYDTIDISAYRGLPGTLSFQVTTDADPDLISNLFLDDVALVTGTGQPDPSRRLTVGSPVSASPDRVRRKTGRER